MGVRTILSTLCLCTRSKWQLVSWYDLASDSSFCWKVSISYVVSTAPKCLTSAVTTCCASGPDGSICCLLNYNSSCLVPTSGVVWCHSSETQPQYKKNKKQICLLTNISVEDAVQHEPDVWMKLHLDSRLDNQIQIGVSVKLVRISVMTFTQIRSNESVWWSEGKRDNSSVKGELDHEWWTIARNHHDNTVTHEWLCWWNRLMFFSMRPFSFCKWIHSNRTQTNRFKICCKCRKCEVIRKWGLL